MRSNFKGPRNTSPSPGPDHGLTWVSPARFSACHNGQLYLSEIILAFFQTSEINQHLRVWSETRENSERNRLADGTFSDTL